MMIKHGGFIELIDKKFWTAKKVALEVPRIKDSFDKGKSVPKAL